jgi:CAAX protease family protein
LPVPFLLLALAICAAWLPALPLGGRFRLPPWTLLYAAALLAAFVQGTVQANAVLALGVLIGLALALRHTNGLGQGLAFALLLAWSAALVLHKVPGFDNPVVIDAVRFSPDARPFTQYLNFDKGSVGLILLALLAPFPRRDARPKRRLATEALVCCVVVAAAVLGVATAGGLVRVDPKLPGQTLSFLFTNLFFTCVAEEALFRLLVQDALQGRWAHAARAEAAPRWRVLLAIVVCGALFGAAHAAGGPGILVMATLAGLAYGAVYAWTRRIGVAILAHFGVNALHFVAFTYPALQA